MKRPLLQIGHSIVLSQNHWSYISHGIKEKKEKEPDVTEEIANKNPNYLIL